MSDGNSFPFEQSSYQKAETNWFDLDKTTFGFLVEDFLWSYFVKQKLQKKKKPAYLLWQMFIICIENANAAFMKLKTRGLNKDLFFLKLSGLGIVASNIMRI